MQAMDMVLLIVSIRLRARTASMRQLSSTSQALKAFRYTSEKATAMTQVAAKIARYATR